MIKPRTPDLEGELASRIRLVRRDMSSLLFHFTRSSGGESALSILRRILQDGRLLGNGKWTDGLDCVCFTEAPIPEFAAIFSLVEIAASAEQRPRYEPYGIAVTKEWLFRQGGRPVIYEHASAFGTYATAQHYRLVPFDPQAGIDFTWEREWRIRATHLTLDPTSALVVVPTANQAFQLMDRFLAPPTGEGTTASWDVQSQYHNPKWMAVSLDLFGVKFESEDN